MSGAVGMDRRVSSQPGKVTGPSALLDCLQDGMRLGIGGTEHVWIDTVDLAMMATHGSGAYDSFWNRDLSSVYYSTDNDNWHLSPGESYRALGDDDLEWLAWDSCSVLDDRSAGYWYTTFDGLHLMLGFANTMYVVYPGGLMCVCNRNRGWWFSWR